MKIVFLSTLFGSAAGGAEVATELLVNELRKAGHIVFIITTRKPTIRINGLFLLDKLTFIPTKLLVPGSFLTDYLLSYSIGKRLKEIKPDVIHTIDSFILPGTVIANRKLHIPLVTTCHNNILDYYIDSKSFLERLIDSIFGARNKRYIKCLKDVDKVISVSDYIKNELISVGLNENKIHTIRNIPIDPTIKPILPKKKMNSTFILFTLGRLVREKGFDVIIKAMKLISHQESNVKLIIAGDGPEKHKLKKLVYNLELASHVEITGRVKRERIIEFYVNSDVVLLTSIHPDPCPMVACEAMYFNKPLIASKIGGIPETVVDGVNGLLFSAGNPDALSKSILYLIRNPSLREKMGAEGQKILGRQFDINVIIDKTSRLYEAIIAKNRFLEKNA